jgi:hypothetical protein
MADWLTWPADLLMSAGGIVAGWFAGKNTPTFLSLQIGVHDVGVGGYRVPVCIFANLGWKLAVAS